MDKKDLDKILKLHKLWLKNDEKGKRANLAGANLEEANLEEADLEEANLAGANLAGANLVWANLAGANLEEANLEEAILAGANLARANLEGADLTRANLAGADLTRANLAGANLAGAKLARAKLAGAKLAGANLAGANLEETNLSQVKGLLSPISFMKNNFKKNDEGYIVYKAFGNTPFDQSIFGNIEEDKIIEEVANSNRTDECGCGVNFGTLEYIEKNYSDSTVYECLLSFDDLPELIVPYNTDGKARCSRLKILKKIK